MVLRLAIMSCSCRREVIRQQGGRAAITRRFTCHAYVKLGKQIVEVWERGQSVGMLKLLGAV